ncbi:MAG: hypothetical protein JNM17_25215 [Archangium sp.]|nr:hypothetical protein [Archangium sp.]
MTRRFWLGVAAPVVLSLGVVGTARAWHEPNEFADDAASALPGGGNLFGTGSKHDQFTQCFDCHRGGPHAVGLTFTFTPAMGGTPTAPRYTPGQSYAIVAHLTVDTRTHPMTGRNLNGFLARFERAGDVPAGTLRGSMGFTTGGNCPPGFGTPQDSATMTTPMLNTMTVGACDIVMFRPNSVNDWNFTWTAPPAGQGDVTILWGAVDGNADLTSKNDDCGEGRVVLTEGP